MIRWALLWLGLAGCSDAALELLPDPPPPPVDDRLAVVGDVCTSPVEELVFPLRVLFLVDASESMRVTDPPDPITGQTQRERAVREAVTDLLTGSEDVEVSVVRFSAEAQPLTVQTAPDGSFDGYFTDDLAFVLSRLSLLSTTDRTTNFVGALSEAYAEVRDELTRAEQASLALSSYHVILLTDGIPDAEDGDGPDRIIEAVDDIRELGRLFRVDRMTVNTALLASGNPSVDAPAEDLLRAMAEQGEGTYRSFASGGQLDFFFVDLTSLRRVFTLKTLVAQNLQARVVGEAILPDSDGDGLDDEAEGLAGTDPALPDTDGDGCRDSLEADFVDADLDPLDPTDCDCFVPDYCFDLDLDGLCDNGCTDADLDALCDCLDADLDGRCDPENYPDGDGDGLVDCEERWSGTHRRGADTDGDGLLDFHEIRFGTSPDVDDAGDDADWDAVPNGEEVRTGTDPREASAQRWDRAYRYDVVEIPGATGQSCYTFEVRNITLTEVGPDPVPGAWPGGQGEIGRNRVLVYLGEVPFDDRDSFPRYRVACVEARLQRDGNWRDPPSGRIRVTDANFVDLPTFDPDVDCVRPGG